MGGRLTIGPFVRASPLRRRIAALGCEHACRAVLPSAEARGYLRDEHVLRSKLQLPEERVAGVREVLVTSGPVPRPLEPYPPTVDDLVWCVVILLCLGVGCCTGQGMAARHAPPLDVIDAEVAALRSIVRPGISEQRAVTRARGTKWASAPHHGGTPTAGRAASPTQRQRLPRTAVRTHLTMDHGRQRQPPPSEVEPHAANSRARSEAASAPTHPGGNMPV